jgi:hypothetical protein
MGYWLVNTPGIGSMIVFAVGLSVLAAYVFMLRWIQTTPPENPKSGEPAAGEAGGEEA